MAADDLVYKLKQMPPKVWAMIGISAVLVIALAWAWWPEGAAKVDPAAQQALDAIKNDKDANPPVADVPPPTDGPRRKAIKTN